jgi:hypothetical protein
MCVRARVHHELYAWPGRLSFSQHVTYMMLDESRCSDRADRRSSLFDKSLTKQFEDFALTSCKRVIGFRFRRRFVVVPEQGANQAAGDLGWRGEATSGNTEVLYGYYAIDETARRSVFEEAIKKALKAHGPLLGDEMYGFTHHSPWRRRRCQKYDKAKMREHLAILANLHGQGGIRSPRKSHERGLSAPRNRQLYFPPPDAARANHGASRTRRMASARRVSPSFSKRPCT